jgi:hypothetical protein
MSATVAHYFSQIETLLTEHVVVLRYEIRRQDMQLGFGSIRVKVWLREGELLELAEAVADMGVGLERLKYSYHWQDKDGSLLKRWDNAPHFPDLPHFPHHIHTTDDVIGTAVLPTLAAVLTEIEGQ